MEGLELDILDVGQCQQADEECEGTCRAELLLSRTEGGAG